MRYFFILGTNPVLSAAEIIALLPGRDFTVTELYQHALIVDASPGVELDYEWIMGLLGGTIKIGALLEGDYEISADALEEVMLEQLSGRVAEIGNATFGISIYSLAAQKARTHAAKVAGKFRRVGMQVKSKLKAAGCSARWVKAQQGDSLTSVAVEKNKMIRDGAEFCVLAKEGKMYVGKTAIVQPFESFSKADYGRPERDPVQGMLPPKLARIMINLMHVSKSRYDVAILDPFCGSGTVLTEALRMGFHHVFGSDLNPEAVENTKKNIAWVHEKGLAHHDTISMKIETSDARLIGEVFEPGSIDGVVTEPYLGPPMKGGESRSEMHKRLAELTELYVTALRAWHPLLSEDAPIIMAMPVYIHGLEKHGIDSKRFEEVGYETESLLPSVMLSRMGTKATKNKGLLYGRNDQRVWREIVRLRAR